jgi:hypothetical protein
MIRSEFPRFAKLIGAVAPAGPGVHLICDSCATAQDPRRDELAASSPRFYLHFAPTQCVMDQPGRMAVRRAHQPETAPFRPPHRRRVRSRHPQVDQRMDKNPAIRKAKIADESSVASPSLITRDKIDHAQCR